jgi:translation initiation factor IF-3
MASKIDDLGQIRAKNVRLVMETGSVIIDKAEALSKALAEGMDLVMVQEGDIPVVKLCNFDKIEYEKQKCQPGNRPKKAKQVQIGPHTQDHDLRRIAAKAEEFIKEGHCVSLRMEVRGRDRKFYDLLSKKVQDFVALIPSAKQGHAKRSDDGSTYSQQLT